MRVSSASNQEMSRYTYPGQLMALDAVESPWHMYDNPTDSSGLKRSLLSTQASL